MDHDAVLAHPIGRLFGHLADRARLGDWLPAATAHPGRSANRGNLRDPGGGTFQDRPQAPAAPRRRG